MALLCPFVLSSSWWDHLPLPANVVCLLSLSGVSKFSEWNQQCHVWHLCPSWRSRAMTRHLPQDGMSLFFAQLCKQFPLAILCDLSVRGFCVGLNTLAWLLLHKKVIRMLLGVRGIGVCCDSRGETLQGKQTQYPGITFDITPGPIYFSLLHFQQLICVSVFISRNMVSQFD